MTERMGRKVGTGSVGTEGMGVIGVGECSVGKEGMCVMGGGTGVGTKGMGVLVGDTLKQCWDGRQ